jgi:hypothetical protein
MKRLMLIAALLALCTSAAFAAPTAPATLTCSAPTATYELVGAPGPETGEDYWPFPPSDDGSCCEDCGLTQNNCLRQCRFRSAAGTTDRAACDAACDSHCNTCQGTCDDCQGSACSYV